MELDSLVPQKIHQKGVVIPPEVAQPFLKNIQKLGTGMHIFIRYNDAM